MTTHAAVDQSRNHAARARRQNALLAKARLYAVNLLLDFVFIFPIVFMIVWSFKTNDQIFHDLGSIAAFTPSAQPNLGITAQCSSTAAFCAS